jgi:hypothetical protein
MNDNMMLASTFYHGKLIVLSKNIINSVLPGALRKNARGYYSITTENE